MKLCTPCRPDCGSHGIPQRRGGDSCLWSEPSVFVGMHAAYRTPLSVVGWALCVSVFSPASTARDGMFQRCRACNRRVFQPVSTRCAARRTSRRYSPPARTAGRRGGCFIQQSVTITWEHWGSPRGPAGGPSLHLQL